MSKRVTARAKEQRCSGIVMMDAGETLCVPGYTSLDKCPEIMTAVRTIARIIGSITIHIMKNGPNGDERIINELSRKIDIEPNPYMNRSELIEFLVATMLLYGDGNAIARVRTEGGYLRSIDPIPADSVSLMPQDYGYTVTIGGTTYTPDEVLHFRLDPDPHYPWKGRGLRISLRDIAQNLKQAAKTTKAFMESEWKPSVIVKVDALTKEFSSPDGRKKLLDSYVSSAKVGEPWMIPAEQFDVQQVKPLSLQDLAIADTVKLDKQTVASIIGVPGFVLGVGNYSQSEWNGFVEHTIRPIVVSMQQEMTRKLILSQDWYIRFNYWSLLDWDLATISAIMLAGVDRGVATGNEWRDRVGMQPLDGLDELRILENYIPADMIGNQAKLVPNGGAV